MRLAYCRGPLSPCFIPIMTVTPPVTLRIRSDPAGTQLMMIM